MTNSQQQWLEWRRQGIGASDAPVIMGVSPYKTRNQLWKEKVLGESQKDNLAMKRGRELEDPALNFFMTETGYFLEVQVTKEHPVREWMRATLDGYDLEKNIAVEIKSCKILHDEVPIHYYPQLQHQLEVMGDKWMYYMSFDGEKGKILEVERDDAYIQEMIEKEESFWKKVQKGILYMGENEEWKAHVEGLLIAKAALKEAQEQESFHLSQLILFSEGCNAYGNGALLQFKERKGNIDYSAIPELKEMDLEPYRKAPSQYWGVDFSENYA